MYTNSGRQQRTWEKSIRQTNKEKEYIYLYSHKENKKESRRFDVASCWWNKPWSRGVA